MHERSPIRLLKVRLGSAVFDWLQRCTFHKISACYAVGIPWLSVWAAGTGRNQILMVERDNADTTVIYGTPEIASDCCRLPVEL